MVPKQLNPHNGMAFCHALRHSVPHSAQLGDSEEAELDEDRHLGTPEWLLWDTKGFLKHA